MPGLGAKGAGLSWRRLVRDYEQRIDTSEAMIHVAMGSMLLRGVSHRPHSQTDSGVVQVLGSVILIAVGNVVGEFR